jgi:hypothetical protein
MGFGYLRCFLRREAIGPKLFMWVVPVLSVRDTYQRTNLFKSLRALFALFLHAALLAAASGFIERVHA